MDARADGAACGDVSLIEVGGVSRLSQCASALRACFFLDDRYVHGQRVVMLLPTSEVGTQVHAPVLDFNVHSALDDNDNVDDVGVNADVDHPDEGTTSNEKNKKSNADPSLRRTILKCVTYHTWIAMPNIFVDVVESGLPYREARKDTRGEYSGVTNGWLVEGAFLL